MGYLTSAALLALMLGRQGPEAPIRTITPHPDYSQAKNLKQALDRCHDHMLKNGAAKYAYLVTDDQVKKALLESMKGYESLLQAKDSKPEEAKFYRDFVEPTVKQIAEDGKWAANCRLEWYPDADDQGKTKDFGFHLRLHIDTPGQMFDGFAHPIVDVSYALWLKRQ